ncbi:hypothetical protein K190097F3_45350 [Enterocloster clostridioformis]
MPKKYLRGKQNKILFKTTKNAWENVYYLHNKKEGTDKKLEYIKLHINCNLAIKCNLMIAKIKYMG